jgi:hypothetical protein
VDLLVVMTIIFTSKSALQLAVSKNWQLTLRQAQCKQLPLSENMETIEYPRVLLYLSITLLSLSSVAVAEPLLSWQPKVQINGVGDIRIGMTPREAIRSARMKLVAVGEIDNNCYYIRPQKGSQHISMMVVEGRIARIDINPGSSIRTLSGAGIGDSEQQIKQLYRDRLKVSPHKYLRGHYLTFTPTGQTDRNYRLIFETDGHRVVNYRVGKMPEVAYVEGCS